MDIIKIRDHIIGWTIFIAFENLIIMSVTEVGISVPDYLLHILLIFIFFYFNTILIFNTQVLSNVKRRHVVLLVLAELLIYSAFVSLAYIIRPVQNLSGRNIALLFQTLQDNVWRLLYFIWLSGFYWLGVAYLKKMK